MKDRLLCLALVWLTTGTLLDSHPRHSDPILAELNDYLMALQHLKAREPEAGRLFERWQALREASWVIRELTDQGNLPITAPRVREQVERTRLLREQFRSDCLRFLESLAERVPTARIRTDGLMRIEWPDSVIETAVGTRALVLLELDNSRGSATSLELSGERASTILFWNQSLYLESGQTRYAFAYPAPTAAGEFLNRITIRRGGETIPLSIRARGVQTGKEPPRPEIPGPSIRFRVTDSGLGRLLPVRIEVRDRENRAYWDPIVGTGFAVTESRFGHWETPLWPYQQGPYFYIDGEATLGTSPEGKTASIFHGFEYRAQRVPIPEDGLVEVRLERWIDMPGRGWYPGQTHIHTTDQGIPVPYFDSWPLISQAEGLLVSNILTLKGEWTTHAIYADEFPMGEVPVETGERHLVAYGEEYRNNPYGHLCLLGLQELIQPISSGALGELGGADYPPNAFVLELAQNQGATTVGAHFGLSILNSKPIATPWPSTGFEMPIDVALGRMEVAEVYGNGGQLDVWYRLLNSGFEIPTTAGPDWVMKDTPRTYVFLGSSPFDIPNWLGALRRGESFVTHGPMIFLTVEGRRPGARIHFPEPEREVAIQATALLPGGPVPVELIVNGEVVRQGPELDLSLHLTDSCWIAARTEECHTNPVYVTLNGRPRGFAEDADDFLVVADRLGEWVRTKALFDSEDQKNTVLEVISQGRSVFEQIIERAQRLKRVKHQ